MLQQHNSVKVLQNQTLAIPLNTISEYLNPYIENRIPTQRMIILTVQYSTSARPSVYLQIQKYLPAEEDLSQSPTHRHLSGCSVLKYKTNQVFHLINIQVTGRQQNRWDQRFYLLLGCKNNIHEVHVLAGTVLGCFYHLSSHLKKICQGK